MTDDIIEQVARVLFDWDNPHPDQTWSRASSWQRGTFTEAAVMLADAGLLARVLPTRDEIARAIYDALSGQYGDFRTPTDAADSVLELLEGRNTP